MPLLYVNGPISHGEEPPSPIVDCPQMPGNGLPFMSEKLAYYFLKKIRIPNSQLCVFSIEEML